MTHQSVVFLYHLFICPVPERGVPYSAAKETNLAYIVGSLFGSGFHKGGVFVLSQVQNGFLAPCRGSIRFIIKILTFKYSNIHILQSQVSDCVGSLAALGRCQLRLQPRAKK